MTTHPFLDNTFPCKWSLLTADHIEPDIGLALDQAKKKVEAICSLSADQANYDNTFAAFEDLLQSLGSAWGKVSHLQSVCDNPPFREAHNRMLPVVTEFHTRLYLNEDLWAVLSATGQRLLSGTAALSSAQRRFIEETQRDFEDAGANLASDKKSRLQEIEAELAKVTQKFSDHVLDATNAWELLVDDPARLAGLPEHARKAALQSARSKGHGSEEKPVWRFTLQYPSMEPVMLYAEDESLRREVWTASSQVGRREPHDNRPLVLEILRLRQEKASLLGHQHFPDWVLRRRMAEKGVNALHFVEDFHQKVKPAFDRECMELREFKGQCLRQGPVDLEPWEVGFYSEKLRKARLDFDDEALRPYFPIDRVISGMFSICEELFGLGIREINATPEELWHEQVKLYELSDAGGEIMGHFYADWHPRESKRSGAWMNEWQTGGKLPDGSAALHIGVICGNMTEPQDGKPALLTHREAQTIFHEFGHLLHHLLGKVEVRSLNGIHVAWDFVELPSQILENWCWERESLDRFARHHETGETIPGDLFERLTKTRQFREATASMRQLSFGKIDLEMHLTPNAFTLENMDVRIHETLAPYQMKLMTDPPSMVPRFSHLFSGPTGYASGYYSYKWAEVLEADAFTRFRAEGILNPATGASFRKAILSKGNSLPPMELFIEFMGREPDPAALLERSGIKVS